GGPGIAQVVMAAADLGAERPRRREQRVVVDGLIQERTGLAVTMLGKRELAERHQHFALRGIERTGALEHRRCVLAVARQYKHTPVLSQHNRRRWIECGRAIKRLARRQRGTTTELARARLGEPREGGSRVERD